MTRNVYDILEEPRGETYGQIANSALDYCNAFLLVIRHSLAINQSAKEFIEQLKPYLLSQSEESEWPGTQLFGETAAVYKYKLSRETIDFLKKISDGLFSWTQPDLPEDLCFIRFDGTPWLVTIAHEKDGYFLLSPEEKTELEDRISNLALNQH